MKNFLINEESLFEIDAILEGQDLKQYDLEIENIIETLWSGIGEFEELLQPFFVCFLKNELLPSLYINYLALVKFNEKYENISVNATTTIIDIIGRKLNFKLEHNRQNYDEGFMLSKSHYFINNPNKSGKIWKRVLRNIKGRAIYYWTLFRGVDVLYLNAGKLTHDFNLIPNSLNAMYIYGKKPKKDLPDIIKIQDIVKKNILSMNLAIPSDLIIELLNEKVFINLLPMFRRIFLLAEFIEKHNIKLVISSASSNELFLSLIAAAKISNKDSMVISHGMPSIFNPKLDNYCSYQGIINNFEPTYDGTKKIQFKASWFG